MYVRAASGTRIEVTEERIAEVEEFVREKIGKHDLQLIISEMGVTADWSAAYTPNAGPMDAVVRVQLERRARRSRRRNTSACSATAFAEGPRFSDLEFAFDAGGMIRGAMNEGKSTPINIRVTGKNLDEGPADRRGDPRQGRQDRRRGRRRGSSSGSTTPSTSSTSTAPRPPTSG